MIVILIVFSLILLFLIDVRQLYNSKSRIVIATYSVLMLLGFMVLVIISLDLPVVSPSILIEKAVKFIIER